MIGRPAAALLSGLAVLVPTACADGGGAAGADRVRVVASFYPLYEAAVRVGGERVAVDNLTPAGAEPHDLELNPKQVDRVEDADVVLYLGHGFQPALEELVGRRRGEAVDLLDGLPLAGSDPHVWLDPVLMGRVVERVRRALAESDPEGRAVYGEGARGYRRELERLDGEYRRRLSGCQRRVVVTAHAAFGYLTRRYGLTQQAIAGLSPEAEPDPRRLAELADLVAASGATTVFYETLASPRTAETLAREAGVSVAVLNPIEGLSGAEMAAGQTYLSVMGDNLEALAAALDCGRME